MGQVQVTWVQNEQFVGTDSTKHSIVLSTGGEGTGSKPSDLLLIALGACSSVDVVGILNKKRQKFTGLQIQVSGEQDADPPERLGDERALTLHIVMRIVAPRNSVRGNFF